MLRAERLEPSLRARVWSISPSRNDQLWMGALLLSGQAIVDAEMDVVAMASVSVFVTPVDREHVLRIHAGSEAIVFVMSEPMIVAAIGQGPDSGDIRRLLEQPAACQLSDLTPMARKVEAAFETILEESASEQPGKSTMIEAGLKTVFGNLLRVLPETAATSSALDRGSHLLLRFRQLLERRFRERYSVQQYASELGISPDRLHDLCSGKLGKSPSALVRDRTIHEARILLSRSSLSIKEISDRLSFRDPAHFSRFFKNGQGQGPRAFRQSLARTRHLSEHTKLDFADWP